MSCPASRKAGKLYGQVGFASPVGKRPKAGGILACRAANIQQHYFRVGLLAFAFGAMAQTAKNPRNRKELIIGRQHGGACRHTFWGFRQKLAKEVPAGACGRTLPSNKSRLRQIKAGSNETSCREYRLFNSMNFA